MTIPGGAPTTYGMAFTAGIAVMIMPKYRVAQAKGITFSFDDPVEYVTKFAATIPDASPSLRLDHLAGRPAEIDAINGQVVALSGELGLDAPYNQTLCAILREREKGFR